MDDLDAAKLEEFKSFNDRYYNPNNAVLVVTGDIEITETKAMIVDYFGTIENNAEPNVKLEITEPAIVETRYATEYDTNIQIPAYIFSYITPKSVDKDAYTLDYISSILTGGNSSRMYKRMVDKDKVALQVLAFNQANQDYGTYTMGALIKGEPDWDALKATMDEEINRLQTELISDKEYQKLLNQFETSYVQANSSVEGIASSLATYYMLQGDANRINNQLDIYRTITKEDIKRVASTYLNPNQRVEIKYLSGTDPAKEDLKQ
jgi:predicted Zn-dependent peptidase